MTVTSALIRIVAVILFTGFSNLIFSQNGTDNKIYFKEGMKKYTNSINENLDYLFKFQTEYCSLKKENSQFADSLLSEFISEVPHISKSKDLAQFAIFCNCLDENQWETIQSKLIGVAIITPEYHLVLSRYKIYNQIEYLENLTSVGWLEDIKNEFIETSYITGKNILHLKNIAVLSEIGKEEYKDDLLNFINEFYEIAIIDYNKGSSLKMGTFYRTISSSCFRLIQDIEFIKKTLYLFDNNFYSDTGHGYKFFFNQGYLEEVLISRIESKEFMMELINTLDPDISINENSAKRKKLIEKLKSDNTLWKNTFYEKY